MSEDDEIVKIDSKGRKTKLITINETKHDVLVANIIGIEHSEGWDFIITVKNREDIHGV